METHIFFIRHGEVHNPQDIYYGRLPRFGLSTRGRQQAENAGEYFTGVDINTIYSSPLLRARQTAAGVAEKLGHKQVVYTRLLLEACTPYDGRAAVELHARHWDLYTGNVPPYETPVDILERMQRFLQRVQRDHPGENVIAVTHADLILFLSFWANGYEVSYDNKARAERGELAVVFPAHTSVTHIACDGRSGLPRWEYRETWQN